MSNPRGHKESVYYWWCRVRQPIVVRRGKRYRNRNYAVEFRWAGERVNWSLGTIDRKEAAERARRMWLYLAANGMDELREKYR